MGRAWPVLILLAFTQFCASWGSLTIIGVQVEMRDGLNVSGDAIAGLIWSYSFSIAVGAILAQVLIGHWPRRAVLLCSMSLLGLGACFLGLAQTWEQAMIARVLMAVGGCSIMPTTTVIAASLVPESQRPAALSVVFTGLTASLVLALPIASLVSSSAGWRAAWFVSGGSAFIAVIGLAWGVPAGIQGTRATFKSIRAVLADRATSLTILTTLLLITGGFMTYAMVSFWLVEVTQTPRWAVIPILLASGIASTAGNILSSPILKNSRPRPNNHRRYGLSRRVLYHPLDPAPDSLAFLSGDDPNGLGLVALSRAAAGASGPDRWPSVAISPRAPRVGLFWRARVRRHLRRCGLCRLWSRAAPAVFCAGSWRGNGAVLSRQRHQISSRNGVRLPDIRTPTLRRAKVTQKQTPKCPASWLGSHFVARPAVL